MKDGIVSTAEIPRCRSSRTTRSSIARSSYVGGNATLFVYDDATKQFVRRTTNVKKENGDRAVGTQLAADHPGQAVLRRGEAYKGPATLFGKSLHDGLFPGLRRRPERSIGILYVGIPMAQFDAHAGPGDPEHGGRRPAVAALLVLVLTMLIVRRITKPLTSVTQLADRARRWQSDVEIDCDDRARRNRRDRPHGRGVQEQSHGTQAPARASRRRQRGCAAEQRKAELRNFVDEFQASVGGIIDKVLNSSGEFERVGAPAHRDRAHHCGSVGQSAGASEKASEHVRAAASASDELSSSISEISRRVQESNGIAAEAVGRPRPPISA